jgi:tetratricopeptide (TPR) repeat protein
LGQALKAADRIAEADDAYRQAIALDGMNTLARMGLGELHMAVGRAEQALGEYDLALRRSPAMPAVHMGMGHALACLDRNADALASYEQALVFAPRMAEAEFACGFVLVRLGRREHAEMRYRRAIALRPDFAAAWMNLGCLLRDQGREALAEAALTRAVELRPTMIPGLINLALLRRDQRRTSDAENLLSKALALDPDNVHTQIAWCQHCAAERDLDGSWQWLRKALARELDNVEAINMEGILLHAEERFAEAVEVFQRAEALDSPSATSNRGNSLMDMGLMNEALHAHREAVARDPQSPGAAYNLALTELRLGDWQQGWPRYEARLRFREVHRTPMQFRQPRWQGEPLAGRRLLLHAEQGLGDTLQFCRYAALVAARGASASNPIVLQVHEPAVRLLKSLDVVRSGQAVVAQLGIEPPAFDLECPLLSLPAIFSTTPETVPWPGPYLAANPAFIETKSVLFSTHLPRIGIAWAGNPRYKADHRRSMRLETLLPLLRLSDFTWIALQKGEAAAQIAALPGGVPLHDGSSQDRDLAETAALVATLDLVITTDTSIAHLAGALGKPVWILLSHLADWRWMQKRETTPWYPTARLFRQPAPGDWAAVLRRVTHELSAVS